jgi:hypothetical protein
MIGGTKPLDILEMRSGDSQQNGHILLGAKHTHFEMFFAWASSSKAKGFSERSIRFLKSRRIHLQNHFRGSDFGLKRRKAKPARSIAGNFSIRAIVCNHSPQDFIND